MHRIWTYVLASMLLVLTLESTRAADHEYGPWSVEYGAALHVESNSNVYYQSEDATADTLLHIVPSIRVEYEKLQNVLFDADLKFDILTYFESDDANMVETFLHMGIRPVRSGAYMVFSEDYERVQNYSPTEGLLETSINVLKLGGGYRGYHLDCYIVAESATATYSPHEFDSLDYGKTDITG